MAKNNARLYNLKDMIEAGFDPKTGLPARLAGDCEIKNEIRRTLDILDEQDAVNRYTWYNLPTDISGQDLERLIYLKGQLVFFYHEALDKYFFMPYALDGTIDFYGRYNTVHPVPVASGAENQESDAQIRRQAALLSTIKLNVLYDIPDDNMSYDDITHSGVIIRDYTNQLSQTITPRQVINAPVLDIMSECLPMMRTALKNSTGVLGMRVGNQDEESNVKAANRSIDHAAINGQRYIPVVGSLDFQELAGGSADNAEKFLMAMQGLDNYRLSLFGLSNGGLFQKNTHMLQAEQTMNENRSSLAMQDGLLWRQRFCEIANAVFGTIMWVEESKTAVSMATPTDSAGEENNTAEANNPDEGGGEDAE